MSEIITELNFSDFNFIACFYGWKLRKHYDVDRIFTIRDEYTFCTKKELPISVHVTYLGSVGDKNLKGNFLQFLSLSFHLD